MLLQIRTGFLHEAVGVLRYAMRHNATIGGDALLGSDLFKGEVRNISALASVLDGNTTDLAFGIEIKQCVLVQIFCFRHIRRS